MSLPLGRRNGSAGFMDNNNELNMGLPTGYNVGQMTNNQVITTPDQQMEAGETLFVLCTLLSGSVSAKVDTFVPGTTHNFSAPTANVYISSTTPTYIAVDVSTATANGLGWGIQFTAGSTGCQFKELLIFDGNQLYQGEGWADMTSGQNATASSLISTTLATAGLVETAGNEYGVGAQDGTGIVPRGPTASHLFGG